MGEGRRKERVERDRRGGREGWWGDLIIEGMNGAERDRER